MGDGVLFSSSSYSRAFACIRGPNSSFLFQKAFCPAGACVVSQGRQPVAFRATNPPSPLGATHLAVNPRGTARRIRFRGDGAAREIPLGRFARDGAPSVRPDIAERAGHLRERSIWPQMHANARK